MIIKPIKSVNTLIFILMNVISFSQGIAPESPQVSALGKYVDIPVGNFTGAANVSVPIYEINVGDLKFPISLSYHTSGIKVKEEASWVGLGWKLNAGGMITKIINGGDDDNDIVPGTYSTQDPPLGFLHLDKTLIEDKIFDDYNQWKFFGRDLFPELITRSYLTGNPVLMVDKYLDATPPTGSGIHQLDLDFFKKNDTEPDLYLYQIGNLSGKYMYGLDGEAHEIVVNDVKIEKQSNGTTILTDPNGYKYNFSLKQFSVKSTKIIVDRGDYPPPPNPSFPNEPISSIIDTTLTNQSYLSGLYLTEITSPKGEEIKFFYSSIQYSNANNPSKTIKRESFDGRLTPNIDISNNPISPASANSIYEALVNSLPDPEKHITTYIEEMNSVSEQYLDSIVFKGGMINFKKAPRYDVENGVRLSEIEIFSTGNTRKLIKRFQLGNNDYFEAINNSNTNKRLKLNSIVEKGGQEINEKTHSFVYDNTKLPNKNDFELPIGTSEYATGMQVVRYDDAWGYYYGKYSTEVLAKKEINESNMQMGILKQIYYPTGGHTSFKYEANNPKGGLRVKEVSHWESTLQNPIVKRYEYNDGRAYTEIEPIESDFKQKVVSLNATNIPYVIVNMKSFIEASSGYVSIKGLPNSMNVGYGKVVVYEDSIGDNGKTEYIYNTSLNLNLGLDHDFQAFLGSPYYNYFNISAGEPNVQSYEIHKNHGFEQVHLGNLLKKSVFNSEDLLLSEESYEYALPKIQKTFEDYPIFNGSVTYSPIWSLSAKSTFGGGVIMSNNYLLSKGIEINTFTNSWIWAINKGYDDILLDTPSEKTFFYANVYAQNIRQYSNKIKQTKTRTYDLNGGFVESKKLYEYSNHEDSMPYRTTEVSSKLDSIHTYFNYIKNNTDPNYLSFKEANILHPVLKQETFVNKENEPSIKVSGVITNYEMNNYGGFPIPVIKTIDNLEGNTYVSKIIYDDYNELGNIIEYHQKDGISTSIIWGYQGMYPIAKIENATYSEIAQVLGVSIGALKLYDEDDLQSINNLRNSMPNAMISTYTYEPLVGMKTMTDPKGYTSYFEYDGLNRLKGIKDSEEKLVSEYEYNQINPPSPIPSLSAYVDLQDIPTPSDGSGQKTVYVMSNTSWSIISKPTWITTSASSGSNNGSFNVSSAPNNLSSARIGIIEIETAGGLTQSVSIRQAPNIVSSSISATPTNIIMTGSATITISSNSAWSLQKETALGWILVTDVNGNTITSGQGDTTLYIQIDQNYTGSYIGGYIHFNTNDNSDSTSVYIEIP